jgi:serine/threonine-protein kinase
VPDRYLGRHLGRFRVDAIVGSGGFAWVYKGYDPELDIPVAIKVLKPQFAGEETFETRFRHEASIAAKLRHPNIIRILAVGREGAAVFFVMDFLPTGLDSRLQMLGTLPETLLIRMGMDVAAALAFAHREGVIHRDIKTDNIMFDEHGNAIVADFGIARAVSNYVEQTGTNMVVGTPQYFSPEQARGQTLDGRADIYSLGVTLFRASAGVLPFRGDDWYEIARQHVEDSPPRPREFNPALSDEIERIILKCLQKNPDDRYPTGDALRTELVQLLGRASTPVAQLASLGTPDNDTAFDTTHNQKRWRSYRRGAIAMGVAAVIGVGALLVNALRNSAPATAAGVGDTLPPVTVSVPAMSASDSAPAAVGKAGAHLLRVRAPAGAEVTLDGVVVGTGSWKSDSVAPGAHVIAASVHALPGCASARQELKTKVAASGTTTVTVSPKECGYFSLNALPATANFMLAGPNGNVLAHGVVGKLKPLVIPVGKYTLQVTAPYCAEFRGSSTITAGATRRERVRLICK